MSTKRKKPSTSPLRAALAAKTKLRTYFDVATAPSEVVEAAKQRVDIAQQLVSATLLSPDDDVRARAQQELDKAKAGLDECFHRVWFSGLNETDFDALVALHPPTEAQAAKKWLWNSDTFNYALLEACAVDSDLTADEWEAELNDAKRWTRADKARIVAAALACNQQTMADAAGKG